MGFFDKIDNVSGSNVIKKVLNWRSSKMFVTRASFLAFFILIWTFVTLPNLVALGQTVGATKFGRVTYRWVRGVFPS